MTMRDDLKAFIDNELTDAERIEMLHAIENDPELQAEAIELRQISRMIRDDIWQPEPTGLADTLEALRKNAPKKPWWSATGLQLAVAAACTVVLGMILFPVFAQSKQSAKQTSAATEEKMKAYSDNQRQTGFSKSPGRQRAGDEAGGGSVNGALSMQTPASPPPASAKSQIYAQPRFQIKTANLSVEVEDVPKAQQEAESIAKAVGGRVESSSKKNDEGSLATAELTFRVPVGSFETAVNRIRKLGRVTNDQLTGEDVTAQVYDAEARLKVMRAEEDQYVELLKATKKIGEVLSVKERLSQVRQEIESLDAQRKSLREQAAESTINLSLTERPKPDRPRENTNWLEDAWSNAVSGLSAAGRTLGSVGVFLFVFSPIWLPVVLLIWWFSRRSRG